MDLDPKQRRELRAKAHHLHPVVSIGQHGLTPRVLHEIDIALTAHGLIKIRVHSDDRDAREAMLADIAEQLRAAPVQHLGKLLLVWRPRDDDDAQETSASQAPAKPKGPPRKPLANAGNAPTAPTRERRRRRSVNEAIGARALAEVRGQSGRKGDPNVSSRTSPANATRGGAKSPLTQRGAKTTSRRRRAG